MKKNKVIITGGAGFIGSKLSLRLADLGYSVTVIDNLSVQVHGKNPKIDSNSFNSITQNKQIEFVNGDVLDQEILERHIEKNSIIIHLASETGTGQSMYDINKYCNANILGTSNIFQTVINKKIKISKFLVASSRSIYGEGKYMDDYLNYYYPKNRSESDLLRGEFDIRMDGKKIYPIYTDENSKIHPSSIYGLTKQFQENITVLMSQNLGIDYVCLRLQNVYGEGQSLKNPYTGILSIFSNLLRQNKEVLIFEDGKESRDFVHVDDVVEAFILSINNDKAKNKIFNVGSGVGTPVIDIANKLKRFYSSNSKININGAFRIGDIRHNIADLSKIKCDLNFSPSIDLDDGLKRYCEWVNLQELNTSNDFQDSIDELKKSGFYNG